MLTQIFNKENKNESRKPQNFFLFWYVVLNTTIKIMFKVIKPVELLSETLNNNELREQYSVPRIDYSIKIESY